MESKKFERPKATPSSSTTPPNANHDTIDVVHYQHWRFQHIEDFLTFKRYKFNGLSNKSTHIRMSAYDKEY